MEEAVGVQDRINLALSKKETLRRARDLVHRLGNELQQWNNVDDQFDSIAEDLNERFRAVEARENATAERIRVVERQETELMSEQLRIDELERNFRDKEKRLKFLESRLDSCEREIKEKEKELCSVQQKVEESELDFSREDEKLGFLYDRIDHCDEEISRMEEKLGHLEEKLLLREMYRISKEEELISLAVEAEKRDSAIKEKEKQLRELHQTFVCKKKEMEAQHAFEFALKKKELDSLHLNIDASSKELSSLENSVADYLKRLDSKRIELDSMTKRAAEFSAREREWGRQSQEQQQRLDSLLVKIDVRSRELSSLEISIADYSKRLDSKRIELDLITKKAAEFSARESERQSQAQQQQLEERRQQTSIHVGFSAPQNDSYPTGSASSSNATEIKTEPSEFPTHQQYIAVNNYLNPISDNLIVKDVSQMIQGELDYLNIGLDLAKCTLDEIVAKYGQQLFRVDKGFDTEAMKTHIKCLEQITASSPPIKPEVKQGAKDFAKKWASKLGTRSNVHPLEVLGFFYFLAAYKLHSEFSQSEISTYIQMYYSLGGKAPPTVQEYSSGNVIPSPTVLLQQKGNKKRPSSSGLLGEQGTGIVSAPSLKKPF